MPIVRNQGKMMHGWRSVGRQRMTNSEAGDTRPKGLSPSGLLGSEGVCGPGTSNAALPNGGGDTI